VYDKTLKSQKLHGTSEKNDSGASGDSQSVTDKSRHCKDNLGTPHKARREAQLPQMCRVS